MRQLLWVLLFVRLFAAGQESLAQKTERVLITDENLMEIESWKQLEYLQAAPGSRRLLLKMVKKLARPARYDSVTLVGLVDSIAWIKSVESLQFLTNFCCRYIDYHILSDFSRMARTVNYYGGARALNTHYLKDSITYEQHPYDFEAVVSEVMRNRYGGLMGVSHYLRPVVKHPPSSPLPKAILAEQKRRMHCDSVLEINDLNVQHISSPWQLLALHQPPQNRLDSIVTLLQQVRRTDSEADSIQFASWVDQVVAMKTEDSWCLTYTLLCRPIVGDDLNPFNGLHGVFSYYGGYHALNRHYLSHAVSDTLDYFDFAYEVLRRLPPEAPRCYFCKPLNAKAQIVRYMEEADARSMDRAVVKLLRRHSRLREVGGYTHYNIALDSILQAVQRMETVHDAFYDACQEKILLYPGFMTLGVLFQAGDRVVEKCYPIQLGQYDRLWLFGGFIPVRRTGSTDRLVFDPKRAFINPGFIQAQRELCAPVSED